MVCSLLQRLLILFLLFFFFYFNFSESHGPFFSHPLPQFSVSLFTLLTSAPPHFFFLSLLSSPSHISLFFIEKSLQRHGVRLLLCCNNGKVLFGLQNIFNFMLEFVCKLLNKYCWKFFFLCRSNLLNNSLFVALLLFFFLTISLENRPKSTETDWNQNIIEIDGFNHFGRFRLRISQTEIFGFGWPYTYKTDWTEQSTPLPRGKPSWAIYSDGAFVILRLFVEMRREFLEE